MTKRPKTSELLEALKEVADELELLIDCEYATFVGDRQGRKNLAVKKARKILKSMKGR